ncbi:MAG: HigA family addiction module antidote protein [Tannerella sp.]|jgi:addiction module HigA family antidote|nr:HigA family addiction module antidote protein [Tannerella sp.]
MITIPGVAPDMIANNIKPAYPTHPGEVLKDEIVYRGISQKQFAAQIGIQYTVLNEILNCKRPVNARFALLVEAALGIDAELWINMQTRYNMLSAKRDKSFADRLAKIRKAVAML